MPFDDVGDGSPGEAETAGDPTAAPPVVDGMEHFRVEPVRFGALAGLTAEFLAPRPGRRQGGFHSLAEQVAFELRDPGQHGVNHPTVRRIEFERNAARGNHGGLPAGELVERIEKGPALNAGSSGQFGGRDGVDYVCLGSVATPGWLVTCLRDLQQRGAA